jgi:pilus assembly protein FimV
VLRGHSPAPSAGLSHDDLSTSPTIRMPLPTQAPVTAPAPEPEKDVGSLDFDLGDLSFDTQPGRIAPAPSPETGLDFGDFGIGDTQPPALPSEADPLARKLELAEEFRQIGDLEGARDLLEEVVAKADGALKHKAQGMLAALG